MFRLPSLLALIAGAFAPLIASGASAAPVTATTDSTSTVAVLRPLTVISTADLDFGSIIVAGAGTAIIDPVTGAISTTGPLTVVGSTQQAAKFTSTGSRNSVVNIRLPNQPVTLTRVGGTETMTVTNFTLDGPTNRRFPLSQTFDFQVGARLNVAAGQADGSYLGSFTVTVQYP